MKGRYSMTCYERIKQCAEENKISIANLEKACNLGNGTIGKWKNHTPLLSKLRSVADYFGKSVEYFLSNESLPTEKNSGAGGTFLTKQEHEIVEAYRSLSIVDQVEFINFLLRLKGDK
ncbi:MAG: hypothetical protein SPL13_02670, partial [Clostridia bacterium]|nr:hypothetical protein [Clostridia bacterium]